MEEETFTDINEDTEAAADPIGQADLASVMGDGGGPDITNPLTIATDETKNLDNQVELDDPLTLAINQASNIDTSLSPEVALLKAQRISQALGERSPGFDSLVSQYLDPTGTEESYNRQLVAADEDVRLQQEKNKMVNEIVNKKGSLTQFDYDLINGMSLEQFKQFKTNPSTVFEEAYGKAYIDKVVVKENERQNSPLAKWMRGEQPDKVGDTLDLASSFLAKQELIADRMARLQKKWDNRSALDKTGDFLANFIPLAEQFRQFNRFEGSDSYSIFKGKNIQDQVMFGFGLDNKTFIDRIDMVLDGLMNGPKANLWMAYDYLSKFQQYSTSDEFADTFWGLVDAASLPYRTTAKVGRMLVGKDGAKRATQVAVTTPSSRTVIQGAPETVAKAKESLQKALPTKQVEDLTLEEFKEYVKKGVLGPAEPGVKPGFERIERPEVETRGDINGILYHVDQGRNLGYEEEDIARFIANRTMTEKPGFTPFSMPSDEVIEEAYKAYQKEVKELGRQAKPTGRSNRELMANVPDHLKHVVDDLPFKNTELLFSDFVKGYDPKEVNVKKVLNATGDTHGYTAGSLTEQATGVKTIATVNDNLPAPINPVANDINKGVMDAPVAPLVNARGQEYFNIIRLTEDAWDVAVQKTIERMKEDITDSSSLLDVKVPNLPVYEVVTPTQTRNNAGYVLHNVGDMHGELFDSAKHAEYYARNWYRIGDNSIDPVKGLPKGGFTVEQHGNGFYIQIKRYVDETHPDARAKLPTGLNERNPGWWDSLPFVKEILGNRMHLTKWLNVAARVADHQTQLINAYFDPERKILGALTKKEQKQLNQFLSDNMFKPSQHDPAKTGVAYDNEMDLEIAWFQTFNETPSQKMVDAYFQGFRNLASKELGLRNDARVRDRARQGLEDWSVNTGTLDESGKPIYAKFGGKRIDKLPTDTVLGDTGILVMKDDNTTQYLRLSKMTPEDRTKIQSLIDNEKYSIIQLENHHQKPLKPVVGEEVVSYVVTKRGVSKPISDKQINENPGGGHVVYTDKYAVAQGQIVRIDDYAADGTKTTRHQYSGDRIVFSATSTDEMNRITKAMETARKLLLAGNDGALQAFLDSNLPFKLKQFKAHFNDVLDDNGKVIEKARWDKNVPFMGRDYGKLTIDQNPSGYAEFTNLENLFTNKHSILTDIENKFVSERDPRVWRVIESGTWGTPDYRTQLGYANVMDPIAAMNKGIQAAVKSQYFKDYQVTALETFASTYLPFMKKEVRDNFYTDMTKYITRSDIWEVSSVNKELLVGAENMRSAINNLISTQTENELREGIFRQKMENLAYSKKGQKGADFVSNFELASTLDPRVFMPTIAYHAKIGLLNIAQYWTQLQTFVNLSAISGMTGIRTFGAMYPARLALFNPNMEDSMAKLASKVSSMKPEEFKDALRLMKAQGFDKVEGDHTWVHEILSNTNPYTKYGRLKDFTQLPFKEGEKATRIASFFSAYKEFVRDNPGKHIGTHEAQLILDRAGTLAGNMTKHANANWQRGWTNIPTQFWSVQARLAELLIGHELSGWEKVRVMIGNSMMYGVPAGVLGTAIGVYPWTETVKGQFLESGVDITNPKVKVFLDGIPSALMQLMTGKDYDFTGKYGPQGIPFLRDLFVDGDFMKALSGVSGALFGDMLKATMPVTHYLTSNMTFSNDTDTRMPSPDMSDYIDALRNISSVNNGVKAYMAFSLGKLVSKNEIYLADVDTVDGIAAGIFGLTPRAIADVSLMARNLKYQKESQKVAEEQVTKYYRRAVEAYADGNRELGDRHLQAARVYLKLGEFQVPEMNRILGEARKGWESYEQRITHDFFLRKTPLSKVEDRRNQFLNRGN